MDTENTRITRAQAAELAGVSERQINRWSAAGLLKDIRYGPIGSTVPATYDPEEVVAAAERWAQRIADMKTVQLPE